MADIYGKVTEHPEYPIEDVRRFTIEIKPHAWEPRQPDQRCATCGFERQHPVHEAQEV